MEIPKNVLDKMNLRIEKHPKSICIANYKGGVGKTSITTLLGYYLAYKKYKVLLFDIDPQCSLSLAVGHEPQEVNTNDFTIYNLVKPNNWGKISKVKFNQYIANIPDEIAPETLKIVKGSFNVDELDMLITREIVSNDSTDDMLFSYCRNMLNAYDEFDFILVDCPPNKMYLTQAMLRACSYYLTVTIPDKISVYGMPRLLRWVNQIPSNERPKLLGCILNGVNRSGGNELGTNNQQNAQRELLNSVYSDLSAEEKNIITGKILLSYIPRLDVISRFLSQGDSKMAWYDFKKSSSQQKSVADIMMQTITNIENRIEKYAQG